MNRISKVSSLLIVAFIWSECAIASAPTSGGLVHSSQTGAQPAGAHELQVAQKKAGAKKGGAKRKTTGGTRKTTTTKKAGTKAGAAPAPAGPGKNANVKANKNTNVNKNVNKNVNVNVNRNVNVVSRPRGWRGRHWGAVVFGVTLGTIIVVAANTPPPAPDLSLCWTWTNDAMTEGFWYYCTGS
jgi:hypothetical protein